MTSRGARRSVIWLGVYAVAMAYVEAAVVLGLRRIHYPGNPLALFPLPDWPAADLLIELGREVATLAMILAVSLHAAGGAARRLGTFFFVFGVWDLFYYVWLKVLLGWPTSWLEWDILFLIPWAWLGPWIAPAIVAPILAWWGARLLLATCEPCFARRDVLLSSAGAVLLLASFLEPAAGLLEKWPAVVADFRPGRFLWEVYLAGIALLLAGLRPWRSPERT
jgi:hypothetical protein